MHLPESPFLESLYTQKIQQIYDQEIEMFRKCSAHIIKANAKTYGLSNREFIDRNLTFKKADYSRRKRRETLTKEHNFDPDHMNFIGAKIFTKELLVQIF